MSQVNFVEQFNLFMRYARANKLTSYERIFYLGLFHCANDLARQTENFEWPDDYFPVSNVELNGWTAFDERAIRNTRNSLKTKGLLDFQKGDGKKSDPMYRIFYLRKIGYKIAPDNGGTITGSENAGGQYGESRPGAKTQAVAASAAKTQAVAEGSGAKTQAMKESEASIGCEIAPDCAGDPVGDPVGGPVAIGCENAGEYYYNKPNVNSNANTATTTTAEQEQEEGPGAKTQAVAVSPAKTQAITEEPGEDGGFGVDPDLGRVMSFYMDHFAPIPTALAIDGLKNFKDSLSADVVIHAMEIALAERKSSWSYIRSILNRYQRDGLNNMPAVLQSEQEYQDSKTRQRPRSARAARNATEQNGPRGGLVDLGKGFGGNSGLVPGLGSGRW